MKRIDQISVSVDFNSNANPACRRVKRSMRFTLIELLVVIAIIAILAAMLLPALSAARESAKLATCTDKMKGLMMAILNYADAHEETLPYSSYSQTHDARWWVSGKLNPYYGGDQKINNKSKTRPLTCDSADLTSPDLKTYHPVTYGMSYYASCKKLGSVPNPSSTIIFTETYKAYYVVLHPTNATYGKTDLRHNGKATIGLLDGHADIINEALEDKTKSYGGYWLDPAQGSAN